MKKIFEDFFDEVNIDSEDIKQQDEVILQKTPEYKINLFLAFIPDKETMINKLNYFNKSFETLGVFENSTSVSFAYAEKIDLYGFEWFVDIPHKFTVNQLCKMMDFIMKMRKNFSPQMTEWLMISKDGHGSSIGLYDYRNMFKNPNANTVHTCSRFLINNLRVNSIDKFYDKLVGNHAGLLPYLNVFNKKWNSIFVQDNLQMPAKTLLNPEMLNTGQTKYTVECCNYNTFNTFNTDLCSMALSSQFIKASDKIVDWFHNNDHTLSAWVCHNTRGQHKYNLILTLDGCVQAPLKDGDVYVDTDFKLNIIFVFDDIYELYYSFMKEIGLDLKKVENKICNYL